MIAPSSHNRSSSDRVYRLFFYIYPSRFRRAYGHQMAQTFRDCCRAARQQAGIKGLLDLWIHTLYDLVVTASTEQISAGLSLLKHLFGLEKEYTMSNYALNLDVALRTDIGRTRQFNEDAMISAVPQDLQVMQKKGALFVVADGMGGQRTSGECPAASGACQRERWAGQYHGSSRARIAGGCGIMADTNEMGGQ